MRFATVEYFQALQAQADRDPDTFRRLGFCDSTVRVAVESAVPKSFVLTFNDYGCGDVEEVDPAVDVDVDFSLCATAEVWREMIENIREHGQADLQHTLNYLQLPGIIRLEADDQQRADLFYRFNQTYQAFFDQAAEVEVEFDAAPVAAR